MLLRQRDRIRLIGIPLERSAILHNLINKLLGDGFLVYSGVVNTCPEDNEFAKKKIHFSGYYTDWLCPMTVNASSCFSW
jgi:hypothetical protein